MHIFAIRLSDMFLNFSEKVCSNKPKFMCALTDVAGGFCGYRNIQMVCSYIIGVQSQGHESFNGKIPNVFEIQEWIEEAWDFGINTVGRIETGGVRGTRKYIGTPEVSRIFSSILTASYTNSGQGTSNVQ